MKTTNKSTHNTKKTKSAGRASNCRGCKNNMESKEDPDGSYTGNPVGLGKYEQPIQDADDL